MHASRAERPRDLAPLGRHEHGFVSSIRPTIQGFTGAVVLIAVGGTWAWSTGRATLEMVALWIVIAVVALPIVAVQRRASLAAHAKTLGQIEVDDSGIRWRRPDATLHFTTSWADIERVVMDVSTLLLVMREGSAFPLAVFENGTPSAQYAIDRRDELVELIRKRVPIEAHVAAPNVAAGTRAMLVGLGVCVAGAALYGANLVAASLLHWDRFLVMMPAVMGGLGLLTIGAGQRLRSGPRTPDLAALRRRVRVQVRPVRRRRVARELRAPRDAERARAVSGLSAGAKPFAPAGR